ncbi:hypothetical protein KKF45_04700 [Patescibacteria group bacterium]|nr:hypothetical protein [Patescibacteria group bacterium]
MYSILDDNWNASNVAKPDIQIPTTMKRDAISDKDACYVYSTTRSDEKKGIIDAYRNRKDVVNIDVFTSVDLARLLDLKREVERILDLSTVRKNPMTRPNITTYGDNYDANAYDQLIPTSVTTMEDRNRRWWRFIMSVDLLAFWEAR